MNKKAILILSLFAVLALALSGCAGGSRDGATSWPGVTVDSGVAYVAYNTHVYAINIADGTMKWRYPEKASATVTFYAAPVLTKDGQLIVGGYNHVLYSLDAQTGAEKWNFAEAKDRYIASPLVTDQGIFAPSADDKLYALNLDGSKRWVFDAGGPLWATPVADPKCNCLYLPSMDHNLYAVSADSGSQLWKQDIEAAIIGTPAMSEDGTLYMGTFGNRMVAANSSDGSLKWSTPTKDWVWAGPTLFDGKLYFGDLSGNLYALDQANGQEIWSKQPDGPITGSPLIYNGNLYVTTELGSVFAFSPAGEQVWNPTVEGKLYAPVTDAGDSLLFAPVENKDGIILISFVPNGALRWSFVPPK